MNDLIERYLYDVTRRLPEKDRNEVNKELKSNIYDMLPENADENEIKTVLYQLGPPASLAEKYRPNPRYLISPAIYDDYVRALKWLLPLIGVLVLAIGMILGAIDAIKDGAVDFSYFISNALSKGVAMGLSAVLQALVWTTVGFVIAERTSTKAGEGKEREWKIEDLPEALPDDSNRIPLSDSILELVMTVLFSFLGIALCSGILPIAFIIHTNDTQIHSFFSSSFLASCIPAIVVMALFDICECASKIKERRWTPFICITVVVNSLISMAIMLYLINRPDLFSTEFQAFLQGIDWGSLDLLRFWGKGGISLSIVFVSVIIVLCNLVKCCEAVCKTLKNKTQQER